MKSLFTKPFFKNLPIASIAYYCMHKNLLSVSIKDAYYKYIRNKTIQEHETSLMVNGGTENNYAIVEAVNKVLKYRFLFHNNISDITALEKHLDSFIPVYNNIRPHCRLKYHTPKQIP